MIIKIPAGENCHQYCKFINDHFHWCDLFNVKLEYVMPLFEYKKCDKCKNQENVEIIYE